MSPDDELRESPLPPADDERIRRLLAEARHTEPIPAEIVARLDGVLADLVADRPAALPAPPPTPVVDLAARRRRTAAQLLVAAAAVIEVGVGISQVLPQGGQGDADGGSAMSAQEPEAADGGGAADEGGGSGSEDGLTSAPGDSPNLASPVKIRSHRFGADVRRLRAELGDSSKDVQKFYDSQGCLTVDVGAGEFVPAEYDGAPAVVVLRVPSGDVQVVDLYLCGDTQARRSITLTAP
jgi:hypothetical protein